ncbi:hypothetical protein ATCC90586_008974 [Pythium insidiosum]|nr:hypothetical protein ATCC90586_008974 [Pythium insidiosum]
MMNVPTPSPSPWTELQEDPETLRAALAMVDNDWDPLALLGLETTSESGGSGGSDGDAELDDLASLLDNGDGPGDETTTGTKKRRRNRRREEVLYLRDKVTELEANLQALKHDKLLGRRQWSGGPASQQQQQALVASIWVDLATRQYRERQKAEFENVKLRAKLEVQVKVARDLIRLIQRAQRQEDEIVLPSSKRLCVPMEHRATTEAEQLSQLEQLFLMTDERLAPLSSRRGATPASMMAPHREVNVSEVSPDCVGIEMLASWVLPFTVAEVKQAVWKYHDRTAEGRRVCSFREVAEVRGEDTIISQFVVSAMVDGTTNEVHGRQMVKRFDVSEDCGVFVTNMAVTEESFVLTSFAGADVSEETWLRVSRVAIESETAPTPGTALTRIESLRRVFIRRRQDGDVSASDDSSTMVTMATGAMEREKTGRRVGALTEFMLRVVAEELTWKQQSIESTLLLAPKI